MTVSRWSPFILENGGLAKGSNLDYDTVGQRKSGWGRGGQQYRATDPQLQVPGGLSSEMRSDSVVHLICNDVEGEETWSH